MPDLPPFRNEPVLELRRASERGRLTDALAELDARLPLRVPVWVGDDRRDGEQLVSTDPAAPDRVVATAAIGTAAEAERAVATARGALDSWSRTPAEERAHGPAARWPPGRPPPGGSAHPLSCAPPATCAPAAPSSPRSPSASAASR